VLKRIFARLRERRLRDAKRKQAQQRLFAVLAERQTMILDGATLRSFAEEGMERRSVFQAVYDLLQAGRIALGATEDGRLIVSPAGATKSTSDDFSDAILAQEIRV